MALGVSAIRRYGVGYESPSQVELEKMVPPASLLKHFGWFINGISAAITSVVSLLKVCARAQFWYSLVIFVAVMVLPALGTFMLLEKFDIHVNNTLKIVVLYSSMLSVSLPLCYVWLDRLFVLAFEANNKVAGAGYYDFGTYVRTGKHMTVLTDCMLLYIIVLICCAINRVRIMGPLGTVVVLILESLVLCFLSFSSRFERMNIMTRGIKCRYIETHLPFFLGFSLPTVAFATWASTHLPIESSPLIMSLLIATSTLGSSAVRVDELGQPHTSSRILSFAHSIVSLCLPSTSGRGVV
eukprot:TRINITY_DN7351_c0_g3_i2.p1 TRINITY_DN7351_c0_g3~~TRINITY_DN7351_c0_g3_i2.p1  ORF type:complete len:297 (+),score=9.91 TRINITY_DN7351_c0_g3_i2:85-975(+)